MINHPTFKSAEACFIYEAERYMKYKSEWVESNIGEAVLKETWERFESEAAELNIPDDFKGLLFEDYVVKFGYANGEKFASFEEFVDKLLPLQELAANLEDYMYRSSEYAVSDENKLSWVSLSDRKLTESAIFEMLAENDIAELIEFLEQDGADLSNVIGEYGSPFQQELLMDSIALVEEIKRLCPTSIEELKTEMSSKDSLEAHKKENARLFYDDYKNEWALTHITGDIFEKTRSAYEDYKAAAVLDAFEGKAFPADAAEDDILKEVGCLSFEEYVEEYGYTNGETDGIIYASFEEFMDNEFEVWALANELESYMFERGEYEYPKYNWLDWLDKDGIREGTEARVRDMLVDDPKRLYDYIKSDSEGLSADDELRLTAKALLEKISEYCSEAPKKDKTSIERD